MVIRGKNSNSRCKKNRFKGSACVLALIATSGLLMAALSGCGSPGKEAAPEENRAETQSVNSSDTVADDSSKDRDNTENSEYIDSLDCEIISKEVRPSDREGYTAYYIEARGDSPKIYEINKFIDDICDGFWIYAAGKYDLDTYAEITYNKNGLLCARIGFSGMNSAEGDSVSMQMPIIVDINAQKSLTLAEALGIPDRNITNYLASKGVYSYSDPEEPLSDPDEIEQYLQSGDGVWEGVITSDDIFSLYTIWGFHGVEEQEVNISDVGSSGVVTRI